MSSLISLLTVLAALLATASTYAQPMEGLRGYFPFTNGVQDESGNGFDGELLFGATIVDGALHIESNQENVFRIPSDCIYDIGDFTFAANLKITSLRTSGGHTWISLGRGGPGGNDNHFGFGYVAHSDYWQLNRHEVLDRFYDSTMEDLDWHHVALVRQGSTAWLYLDGEVVDSADIGSAALRPLQGGFIVGEEQDCLIRLINPHLDINCVQENNEDWYGDIDDFLIYNRALSISEIQELADIEVESLDLIMPSDPGIAWPIGIQQIIEWSSTGSTSNINIYIDRAYTPPNGNWIPLAGLQNIPNTGSAEWTVTGPVSESCRIAVQKSSYPIIWDLSDNDFSIIELQDPELIDFSFDESEEIFPGQTVDAVFTMHNPNSTVFSAVLDLRYRAPNTAYGEFQPYNYVVQLLPGNGIYTRDAIIPEDALPGEYEIAWYLLEEDGGFIETSGYLPGYLTVSEPEIDGYLALNLTNVDFGSVPYTQSSIQELVLSNPGDTPISIDNLTISGSNVFHFVTAPTLPFNIAAREENVLELVFEPTASESYSGYLDIDQTGIDTSMTVELVGRGVDPSPGRLNIVNLDSYSEVGDNIHNPPIAQEDAIVNVTVENTGQLPYTANLNAVLYVADEPHVGWNGFWTWARNIPTIRQSWKFPSSFNPTLNIQDLAPGAQYNIELKFPDRWLHDIPLRFQFNSPRYSDALVVTLYEGDEDKDEVWDENFDVEPNTFNNARNCFSELLCAFGPGPHNLAGADALDLANYALSIANHAQEFYFHANDCVNDIRQDDWASFFTDLTLSTVDVVFLMWDIGRAAGASIVSWVINLLNAVWHEFNNEGCLATILDSWARDADDEFKDLVYGYLNGVLGNTGVGRYMTGMLRFVVGCPVDVTVTSTDIGTRAIIPFDESPILEFPEDSSAAFLAGDCRVIMVPNESDYELELVGHDDGKVKFTIGQWMANGTYRELEFDSIRTTPNSMATLQVSDTSEVYALSIDFDGNGFQDSVAYPMSINDYDAVGGDNFELLEPADEALLSTALPQFTWESTIDTVAPATVINYELIVSTGLLHADTVVYYWGTDTTFAATTSLSEDEQYVWSVRAYDDADNMTISTPTIREFQVSTVNNPPSLDWITLQVADTADIHYTLVWSDEDPDDDALIQLYAYQTGHDTISLNTSAIHEDSTQDYFVWNISELDGGWYNIFAELNDGTNLVAVATPGSLLVARPQIAADSTSIDFDLVRVEETQSVVLAIMNPGTDTLEVSDITVSGLVFEVWLPGAVLNQTKPSNVQKRENGNQRKSDLQKGRQKSRQRNTLDEVSFSILPQGSQEIQLSFTPDEETVYNEILTVHSTLPDLEIPLSGQGAAPHIAVDPDSLAFGEVHLDSTAELIFNVENSGLWELTITDMQFAANSAFAIVPEPEWPHVIFPESSENYVVQFHASDMVGYLDTLIISHDAEEFVEVISTATATHEEIAVNVTALEFGQARVGAAVESSFLITNPGTAPLFVSDVVASNSAFIVQLPARSTLERNNGQRVTRKSRENALRSSPKLLSDRYRDSTLDETSFTLSPDESQVVLVSFIPTDEIDFDATITIYSTLDNVVIPASGQGAAPHIAVDPDSLAFGEVHLDSTAELIFNVENSGLWELTITDMQFAANSAFAIVPEPEWPRIISPEGTQQFTVQFHSMETDDYLDTLIISHDAEEAVEVILTATAIHEEIAVSIGNLDFELVRVGTTIDSTFLVSNPGTAPLFVTDILASDPAFVVQLAERGISGWNDNRRTSEVAVYSPSRAEIGQQSAERNRHNLDELTFTLLSGESQEIQVLFFPEEEINYNATITIHSTLADVVIPLIGEGAAPHISVDPDSLGFGEVHQGSTSELTFTVDNSGLWDLTISNMEFAVGEGFTLVPEPELPYIIDAEGSQQFTIRFEYSGPTDYQDTLTILHDAEETASVILTATSIQESIAVNIDSLGFGLVRLESTEALSFTVSNPGTAPLTVTDIASTDHAFEITLPAGVMSGRNSPSKLSSRNNQGKTSAKSDRSPIRGGRSNLDEVTFTLQPNSSQEVIVSFTPTEEIQYVDTITVYSSLDDVVISVTGLGALPHFAIDTIGLNYGSVLVNESEELTVTVSNSGMWDLTIASVSFSVGNAFSIDPAPTWPLVISAESDSILTVSFIPEEAIQYNDMLSFDHDADEDISLTLSGTGIEPILSVTPDSIHFGDVWTGDTSTDSIWIHNEGSATLVIDSVYSEDDGFDFSLTDLNDIAPQESLAIPIEFRPTEMNNYTGIATVVSPVGSAEVNLDGHGIWTELHADPDALDFSTVYLSQVVQDSITLTSAGNTFITDITASLSMGTVFEFSLDGDSLGLDDELQINVSFASSDTGRFEDTLTVLNSVGDPVVVPLAATVIDTTIGVDATGLPIPAEFYLKQNYPNPFNPSTTIQFGLPHVSAVSIRVFDILGREVDQIVSGTIEAGHHSLIWDCSTCSSGIYLIVMETPEFRAIRKAMFLR